MPAAVPQTIAAEVRAQVDHLVGEGTRHLDPSSMEFKTLWRRCDKLQGVDVLAASHLKATLSALSGDLEEMERWLTNARKNGGGLSVEGTRFAMYANLGFVSQAAAVYADVLVANDEVGLSNWNHGIACGAFAEMAAAAERWMTKGVDLGEAELLETTVEARNALAALGVDEARVRAMMDRAGEILRARRLLWANKQPDLLASASPSAHPYFALNYRVDVDPLEAAEMTWELAERLASEDLIVPFVTVAFVSQNIRRAS